MAATPRNRLIGAVHAAKKAAALDDDTYRAKLALVTGGKTSAKDCTDAELRRFLDTVNGKREGAQRRHAPPRTTSPTAKKARALWISLHALGAIADASEHTLRAWVKRQHHVDDIAFVRPAQSFAVIEGLKQWCARLGVNWHAHADPRHCVITRQIELIRERGGALPPYVGNLEEIATTLAAIDTTLVDDMIVKLGRLVRGEHG